MDKAFLSFQIIVLRAGLSLYNRFFLSPPTASIVAPVAVIAAELAGETAS